MRCKDCKHWKGVDPSEQTTGWGECLMWVWRCHCESVCTDFTPKDGEA